MSKQAVVAFNGKRFGLRLNVLLRGDEWLIGFPKVGLASRNRWILDSLPSSCSGQDTACSSDSIEEALAKSINSNPDPARVFMPHVAMQLIKFDDVDGVSLELSDFLPWEPVGLRAR